MKIEPMSVGQIQKLLAGEKMEISRDIQLSLILAWAHERAEKLQSHWVAQLKDRHTVYGGRLWTLEQRLNSVLDEIGWPKDQRG